MRVLNCCLALVLFGRCAAAATATANHNGGGRQGVRVRNNINSNGNGKKAKTNTKNRSLQQQQAEESSPSSSSSSSFVLADKVAALSASDKHRLEQLLSSGGLETISDNENQQQGRRKTMKAEQSDTDLYIGNNADSDNSGNEEEEVFKPEDVTADPRELPLPSDAETGGADDADNDGSSNAGVNADGSSTNGNNC